MNDPLLEALNLLFETPEERIDEKVNSPDFQRKEDEEEITTICFECGSPIHERDDGCICGFKFDAFITCLYQIEGICSVTGFSCDIDGFDYEECDVFRKEHR